MIRVLVVDDSHSARLLLVTLLQGDPEVEVVDDVGDGESAIASARRLRPDVITMDIEMPGMDGLEATARIMNEIPTPIVIVSSSVSPRDMASSFAAMKVGALVALPKPGSAADSRAADDRRTFVSTVKAMSRVKVVRRWSGSSRAITDGGAPPQQQFGRHIGAPHNQSSAAATEPARLSRPLGRPGNSHPQHVSLVALAASTGGPTALQRVLSPLPTFFPVPIVVVQHIARGFNAGFASWLDGECALRVKLATAGETLEPGTVYIAPDDSHLAVLANRKVELLSTDPVNGFRPSASVLFASAADAYGTAIVAVIMTGMGSDGVSGLRRVASKGGYVIAQDEESSLIYGMPGEAVSAGVVDISLPLNTIAPHLLRLATRATD